MELGEAPLRVLVGEGSGIDQIPWEMAPSQMGRHWGT